MYLNVIICINQYKSATKSGTKINIDKLKEILKIPIVTTEATDRSSLDILNNIIKKVVIFMKDTS